MIYKYGDSMTFQRFIKDNNNPEFIFFCPVCGGYDISKDNAHIDDCTGEAERVRHLDIASMEMFT